VQLQMQMLLLLLLPLPSSERLLTKKQWPK